MQSHEVLRQAVNSLGVKSVASAMGVSASLVYKWCQAKDVPDACGADNPLDRLGKILQLTGETGPLQWLCERSGGFFVPNPPTRPHVEPSALRATQEILREFSGLLSVVSRSIEDDQLIDASEAGKIRKVWQDLKSVGESFVAACESGMYAREPMDADGRGEDRAEPRRLPPISRRKRVTA